MEIGHFDQNGPPYQTAIEKMFTNQPFTENKAVDKCKTGTNMLLHISAKIVFIKKSIRCEMQHLMQIDEVLFTF